MSPRHASALQTANDDALSTSEPLPDFARPPSPPQRILSPEHARRAPAPSGFTWGQVSVVFSGPFEPYSHSYLDEHRCPPDPSAAQLQVPADKHIVLFSTLSDVCLCDMRKCSLNAASYHTTSLEMCIASIAHATPLEAMQTRQPSLCQRRGSTQLQGREKRFAHISSPYAFRNGRMACSVRRAAWQLAICNSIYH